MKTYCKGLIMHHYASALGQDPTEQFESPEARQEAIADRICKLIGNNTSTFHFGPDDNLVC
jgi:hypothetical protein